MNDLNLVAVSPSDILSFKLEKNTSPKVIFTLTNVSNFKIVFKVKTTQPTWYYVRPNQQILAPGESHDISVSMVETECNRVMEANKPEVLDKHKFQVLSKVIDEASYNSIVNSAAAVTQSSVEFANLWKVTDEGLEQKGKSLKMQVEFIYGDKSAQSSSSSRSLLHDHNDTNLTAHTQAQESSVSHRKASGTTVATAPVSLPPAVTVSDILSSPPRKISTGIPDSPVGIYDADALQILKSKYDTIVEYTVHLTAERDMILNQLEVMKRESNERKKTKAQASSSGNTGSPRADKDSNTNTEAVKQAPKGFSTMLVLLIVLLSLLLGRYS